MRGREEPVLAGDAEGRGLEWRGGADLGLLIGLQGQEVGLPESFGSLAEGPEKGCLAEAGGRPRGSTGDGEKRTGRSEEGKDELNKQTHAVPLTPSPFKL